MGKTPKANSKQAGKRAAQPKASKAAPKDEEALFQVDTAGDSSVRHSLLHAFSSSATPAGARLRKGTSINKPLRSDLILAARSSVPSVSDRVVPTAAGKEKKDRERRKHIDRETKERLKRIVGRTNQGEGLWGVGEKQVAAGADELARKGKEAAVYDAWDVVVEEHDENHDEAQRQAILSFSQKPVPKAPANFHKHALLSVSTPRAIPLPHPGTSYNPTLPAHQALLANALTHYTAVEEREERAADIKLAVDGAITQARRMEDWEMYEAEVGSGESDSEDDEEDGEAKDPLAPKKASKRKTRTQRNKAAALKEEMFQLAKRRALKARGSAVLKAKEIHATLDTRNETSLADKAATMRALRERVEKDGLTRFRSGAARVPDQAVTFQLGEELADNLRTLTPEGNLWREWVGSGMRRGKVASERAYINKKGGKRGGRGKDKGSKLKTVQKYTYKFGAF